VGLFFLSDAACLLSNDGLRRLAGGLRGGGGSCLYQLFFVFSNDVGCKPELGLGILTFLLEGFVRVKSSSPVEEDLLNEGVGDSDREFAIPQACFRGHPSG
jgi:hypothetical protein